MPSKEQLRLAYDHPTRRKAVMGIIGSSIASIIDMTAVMAVAPLSQLLMGANLHTMGPIGNLTASITGDSSRGHAIALVGAVVFGGFIIKDAFNIFFGWWMNTFITTTQAKASVKLMKYYLDAPFSLHAQRGTVSFLNTLGPSVGQVYTYLLGGAMSAISSGITILFVAIALLIATPLPSLFAFIYIGGAALIYSRIIKPRSIRAGSEALAASRAGYKAALHALGGIREVIIRGSQPHFIHHYEDSQIRAARASRDGNFYGSLPRYLLEVLFVIGITILVIVTMQVSAGESMMASIAVLGAASFRILPSISALLGALNTMRMGLPGLEALSHDLRAAEALRIERSSTTEAPLALEKEITVDHLSFHYEDGPLVLDDISLTIPVGQSVALAGSSGAGKSTLVDLILGLRSPSDGAIRSDGTDIASAMASWRKNIAVVPQEVFLLDASLAENIAFDQPRDEIEEAKLSRVIKQAQLDDLIDDLPDGVDTAIGERGSRLSGGQRQRVGIARALYREPELLIMDEATSALDNETEHRITQTIESLHGKMTMIIVAHRLSTVRNVDKVIFFSHGKIDASGTFEEVQTQSEEFAHLVALGDLSGKKG
ncbi:ABC transporter ATP-binding protein [Cutibacterium avidum]|uniref:ABC transporter ATP-binding protein n=1 Tax=Cutibacterium avidum TaxID=33010 RepID=UPI001C324A6A|nr:ABC transporter ATP-binding protein [Cutibacterium avidum]BCQ01768.1 ABC transporter ATP-binding protein [Cutibacterium avidum]